MKIGPIEFTVQDVKDSKTHEWVLRFVFGGIVSLLAGLVGEKYGPAVGGLFLAFPSILPATLTMIVHHRSPADAAADSFGAALGAVALIPFAATILLFSATLGVPLALLLSATVWLLVSFALWKVFALT